MNHSQHLVKTISYWWFDGSNKYENVFYDWSEYLVCVKMILNVFRHWFWELKGLGLMLVILSFGAVAICDRSVIMRSAIAMDLSLRGGFQISEDLLIKKGSHLWYNYIIPMLIVEIARLGSKWQIHYNCGPRNLSVIDKFWRRWFRFGSFAIMVICPQLQRPLTIPDKNFSKQTNHFLIWFWSFGPQIFKGILRYYRMGKNLTKYSLYICYFIINFII